jgi:beta-lactamase regulating signal transducer with metallopeptidase domain
MNDNHFFDAEWIQALGWTLLHSLWQGVIIALLLATVLLIFRKQSANSRYLFGILGLSGLLASIVITFSLIYIPPLEFTPLDISPNVATSAIAEIDHAMINSDAVNAGGEASSIFSAVKFYFEEHMPFIMLLYLIGVLVLTMRLLGELVYIQNLRYSRSQFVAEVWQQKLREIAIKMNVKSKVALKDSILVSSPMTIGFFKPIIFVPLSLLSNLPPDQVESIFAHELAHIRRHDYLINLLQSFVEILLFFNPAVWWISSFIRSEREHCCDDLAIEVTGDELTFARTLANLEEWRIQNSRLAVAFGGKNNAGVLGRVQRLLEKKESTQLPFRLFWAVSILTIGLTFSAFNITEETVLKNNDLADSIEKISSIDQETSSTLSSTQFNNETINSSALESEEQLINNTSESKPKEKVPKTDSSDFDEIANITSVSQIVSVTRDTVPPNIEKLEKEMSMLEKSFQQRKEGLVKQMKELEMKRIAIENDVQKQDYELQTAQLQLQKEMQNIEKEKMVYERELELQLNSQQEIMLDLNYQMQELELALDFKQEELAEKESDEKIEKEIAKQKKEIQEVRKAILLQEKEVHRKELEARKLALMKEKEVQEIQYKNQLKEHEKQMKAHSKEGDLLKFEESRQHLKMQMVELEYELRNKMQELQQKIELEYQKMGKEN